GDRDCTTVDLCGLAGPPGDSIPGVARTTSAGPVRICVMKPDRVARRGTRTERQRARTRRQLLDAGRALIAAKGVAGLRIQEITEQADVALGSFYNYFSSREQLLEAVVSESLSDLAATIITNVPEGADPAEVVALANLRFIRLAYDE